MQIDENQIANLKKRNGKWKLFAVIDNKILLKKKRRGHSQQHKIYRKTDFGDSISGNFRLFLKKTSFWPLFWPKYAENIGKTVFFWPPDGHDFLKKHEKTTLLSQNFHCPRNAHLEKNRKKTKKTAKHRQKHNL
jgi:hypothetical protein